MKMKITCLLVGFLFSFFSSLSQKISIVDTTGQPLPFATIEVPVQNLAFFADKNGSADLSTMKSGVRDTFVVSSIGFITRKIAVKDLQGAIVMQRQVKELQEVFAYGGKWQKENWGSEKKPGPFGYSCSWQLNGAGSQIGRVINRVGQDRSPAWIYKISFFTEHAKDTRTAVRLRLYKLDANGSPGVDILQESVVTRVDKGKGWLEFDLSGKEIRFPENGLIVAAEYFDTDAGNWNEYKLKYVDSTGKKGEFMHSRYGGSFATNDEINQGPTWMRLNGYWLHKGLNVPNDKCRNLVVQVWVKYPKK